tara:strand:- start:57 stop:1178 length:1122 start_codon:yes stop_codon:yes gene_type:complete
MINIPIYKPYIKKYKKSAIEAIESEWISNYGEFINKSNELLKKKLGIKYSILMNNGTSATHCLLLALKYKYPNITTLYIPNNVFIAPLNCSLNEFEICNIKVMKMNDKTFNIDTSEEYIKSLDKNSAILIIHNLGNIVNVPRLSRIRNDCVFIEDNCEGIFGKYEEIYSGTNKNTLCSAVSFYANKTITTGEGGAFFTNDESVFNYISKVYSQGMSDIRYIHNVKAFNYRMTNIEAALLFEQLLDLDNILLLKQTIFDNYNNLLNSLIKEEKIIILENEENTEKANWMYSIVIPNINYKDIQTYLNNENIEVRPFFCDIRNHEHLKKLNIEYEESKIAKYGVMLPSFPELTYDEQKYICNNLSNYINNIIIQK